MLNSLQCQFFLCTEVGTVTGVDYILLQVHTKESVLNSHLKEIMLNEVAIDIDEM